jgi:hypothetical protein
MRLFASLASLCAAAALFSGCSAVHNAQQSAADSFHSSFRSSFKSSFIKSCTGQGASEKICTCVEAKVESANADDQLMKLNANSDATAKMLVDDTKACAAGK